MTSRTAKLDYAAATAELGLDPPPPKSGARQIVARGDEIITAAYELLNECGLDGLTVRAVLTKTGFNRRVFYERFSGKDDLVLAVFQHSLQMAAVECRKRFETMTDPLERLKFLVTYLATGDTVDGAAASGDIHRGAALCREHMRLAEARPDDLRAALRPLIDIFSEQLAAGVESGQVRKVAPERLAAFVYNLVSTTVHAEVLAKEAGEERANRAQLAEDLWDFCLGGIAAQGPRG